MVVLIHCCSAGWMGPTVVFEIAQKAPKMQCNLPHFLGTFFGDPPVRRVAKWWVFMT